MTQPLSGVLRQELRCVSAETSPQIAGTRDGEVCTRRLGLEATRLACSAIVLNRGIREAVEARVAAGVSMSEIAMRCDRTKRDRKGNRSQCNQEREKFAHVVSMTSGPERPDAAKGDR